RFVGLDISGDHGSGRVHGWTQILAPEGTPGAFPHPEIELAMSTPSVNVDAVLERALAQNHYLEWIAPTFSPKNGTLGLDWRLRTGPELGGTSGAGTVKLNGV